MLLVENLADLGVNWHYKQAIFVTFWLPDIG